MNSSRKLFTQNVFRGRAAGTVSDRVGRRVRGGGGAERHGAQRDRQLDTFGHRRRRAGRLAPPERLRERQPLQRARQLRAAKRPSWEGVGITSVTGSSVEGEVWDPRIEAPNPLHG